MLCSCTQGKRGEAKDSHQNHDHAQTEKKNQISTEPTGTVLLFKKIHLWKIELNVILELNFGNFGNLFAFEFQKRAVLTVSEHTGENNGGESLFISVVRRDGVIECLAGK